MKRFNKTIVAATMAVGMFAIQAPSYAAPTLVGADAILRLDNFIFTVNDGSGARQASVNDLNIQNGANNGNTSAAIDGNSSSFNGNSPLGASMNIQQAVVNPANALSNNNYNSFFTGSYGTGTSQTAFADADLAGSSILGLGVGPYAVSADTRATAGLETGSIGDATSNLGLLVTFDFIATGDFTLGFSTGYDWTAYTFLDPTAGALGANAQASTSWMVTVTNSTTGAVVGRVTPDELNNTFGALNAGEIGGFQNQVGNIAYDIGELVTGQRYTLNLRHTTEADVSRGRIPEPGIIALMGLGFLGMTLVTRRRMEV
ncbi:MAG TPA: PEP-CTERM sorting domain-containing protein [Nitrosomonas europaea]|uniref:PEP-CTERM sorting domain-containing protein n=1 Tax=Nitrosomonas europaea TaxID=915 RepID=UPI0024924A2F|nr:PEP-CTERM sorting domain-containing protein [Nitrosomonas europaea]HRN82900.1 PEP-CTERM sorting domain-containing protein [Nitrosomonas europaea]HRO57445.1 PEP-CTERM sorting domain-containing protein [Nitrosomonas europaea]HUM75103.1 PEP-CTERM sorting domain-containing protein [Nitrosomonas europaea]